MYKLFFFINTNCLSGSGRTIGGFISCNEGRDLSSCNNLYCLIKFPLNNITSQTHPNGIKKSIVRKNLSTIKYNLNQIIEMLNETSHRNYTICMYIYNQFSNIK